MNDRDSASDWDSMSEREETPPKRSNDVGYQGHGNLQCSSEVTKSEMVPEPSGSRRTNRPRKARNYQVPAKAGTKDPNRFSSPALRSIEGHSSKSDPQRLPGFEPKAGLAEEPKSQEPRQKQVIHAQETLDDIRSDPLDDHDYKDSSEGIANPAFLADSQYVLEEKRDSLSVQESRHHPSKPVKPEESIEILLFRPAETKFFQIHPEDSGLWADKALKPAVHCLSRSLAEILGILKIPFVLVSLDGYARYLSPVNPAMYPHLAVVLLIIGLFFTAWFFVYEVTSTKFTREIVKEILISMIASIFMGMGTLFLLLWNVALSKADDASSSSSLSVEMLSLVVSFSWSKQSGESRPSLSRVTMILGMLPFEGVWAGLFSGVFSLVTCFNDMTAFRLGKAGLVESDRLAIASRITGVAATGLAGMEQFLDVATKGLMGLGDTCRVKRRF
eukprot:maker-scaffold110_size354795-snap-gene-2.21 protein:Tk03435 transcript:maker-scaffold110_size354795-snap-gene-2.21-mRNA-1 annotation:"upf0197 transmembrane protein c11orf10 homolog"